MGVSEIWLYPQIATFFGDNDDIGRFAMFPLNFQRTPRKAQLEARLSFDLHWIWVSFSISADMIV